MAENQDRIAQIHAHRDQALANGNHHRVAVLDDLLFDFDHTALHPFYARGELFGNLHFRFVTLSLLEQVLGWRFPFAAHVVFLYLFHEPRAGTRAPDGSIQELSLIHI